MALSISAVGLHWLPTVPAHADLCAHAGITLEYEGQLLVDARDDELAVSTGALHLLRTLSAEHTPERPVAGQLAPCCGHYMLVDAASGEVANGGCPNGVNWWVRHAGAAVTLELPDGRRLTIPREVWCRAVVAFADAVDAFYAASAPKVPGGADDEEWFAAFRAEWRRRRAGARCAA